MTRSAIPLATQRLCPAYRGQAARTGQVLACPMETLAFDRYLDHLNPEARVRRPDQWWKAEFFIQHLRQRVDPEKVAALMLWRRQQNSPQETARRVGVSVEPLHSWEKELIAIVEEELWPLWKASRRLTTGVKRAS